MPLKILNTIIKQYLTFRYKGIVSKAKNASSVQYQLLKNLVSEAKNTLYGKQHSFGLLKNYNDFKKIVPIVKYDDIFPHIESMMNGVENILWPGKIKYFSKSSGTTNQRSKYIPISNEFLRKNLIRSSWDTTTFIFNIDPSAELFHRKSLIMGGSLHSYDRNKDVVIGDVSAIMIKTIPFLGTHFYTPHYSIALLNNWEEKIEKISSQCSNEDITMFGGVPTWNIVLFNKILEKTGKENILEIWPNLKFYLHGGVNFEPYRSTFANFIPTQNFQYIEAYNASEGYFAIQDTKSNEGMRLLTDNGIFYEFLDADYVDNPDRNELTVTIDNVKLNKNYAIIISGCNGLWRYIVGDTIEFSSLNPYRLKVTGRIEQHINAFGEEVMIGNTDQALSKTLHELNLKIKDYTVAPYYLTNNSKGYHEWLIEFENNPIDVEIFEQKLDNNLRAINSDYDAKRFNDLALIRLKVNVAPKGLFNEWLKNKNKLGGQHKVPRLSNSRKYLDEIMQLEFKI